MNWATPFRDLCAGIGAIATGMAGARLFWIAALAIKTVPDTLQRTAAAEERSATAAEKSSDLISLLRHSTEEREEIGRTIRVISRDIKELREIVDQGRDRDAAETAPSRRPEPLSGEPTPRPEPLGGAPRT